MRLFTYLELEGEVQSVRRSGAYAAAAALWRKGQLHCGGIVSGAQLALLVGRAEGEVAPGVLGGETIQGTVTPARLRKTSGQPLT